MTLRPKPNNQGFVKVDKHHKMFYQTFGNTGGKTFLFLHGGPGYHSTPGVLDNFDLSQDHVILFDQRGSGKSKTSGLITNQNTTTDLCEDINKLLDHLKIQTKVTLFGGSWGATLARVYAIRNPGRVSTLLLRGVFLGRKEDVDAIYYPKRSWTENQRIKYEMTLGHLVKVFHLKDVVKDAFKIISQGGAQAQYFCKYWAMYEDMICSNKFELHFPDKEYLKVAATISTIETYYFTHNCFLPKNYILNNVHRLKDIKAYIVQGTQDMVCPPYQARILHKAIKGSELLLDKTGGHSAATGQMKSKIKRVIGKIRKEKISVSK